MRISPRLLFSPPSDRHTKRKKMHMLGLIPSTKYTLTIRNATKWVSCMYLSIFFHFGMKVQSFVVLLVSNVYEDLFMLLLWLRYRSAEITLNVLYVLMNHDIAFFNNIINGFKKCLWLSSRSTTPKIGMNFASI